MVEEWNEPAFSAEIFREKATKWRNVSSKISLGYLSCGDYQHFDYDFANSFNNIVSIENRFRYLTFNVMAKYSLPVGKGTAFASLGPHFGYLIYSTETSINFVNNEYTQGSYSFLPNEKRFNYGPQYSLGGRYKRISAEAFYKSYYRVPYHNRARRVIMFGVALSFYFQKNKTASK